jgi:hypothetical protein
MTQDKVIVEIDGKVATHDEIKAWMEGKPISSCTPKKWIKLVDVHEMVGYKKGAIHEVTKETEHSYFFKIGENEYGLDKCRAEVVSTPKVVSKVIAPKNKWVKMLTDYSPAQKGKVYQVVHEDGGALIRIRTSPTQTWCVLSNMVEEVPEPTPPKVETPKVEVKKEPLKVGDVVKGVKDTGYGQPYSIKKGVIYTIEQVNGDMVDIKNMAGEMCRGWWACNFKKVTPTHVMLSNGSIFKVVKEKETEWVVETSIGSACVSKDRVTPCEAPSKKRGRPKTLYVKYVGEGEFIGLKKGDIVKVFSQTSTTFYVKSNTNGLSYTVNKENCVLVPKPVPPKVCKKMGRPKIQYVKILTVIKYSDITMGDTLRVISFDESTNCYCVVTMKGDKHYVAKGYCMLVPKPVPPKKECKKRGRKPTKWVQMVSIVDYEDMKNGDIVKVVKIDVEGESIHYRVVSKKGIEHVISKRLLKEVPKPEPNKEEHYYRVKYWSEVVVKAKNKPEADLRGETKVRGLGLPTWGIISTKKDNN